MSTISNSVRYFVWRKEMKPIVDDFYSLCCKHKFKNVTEIIQEGFSGMYFVLRLLSAKPTGLLAGDISSAFGVTTARTAVILSTLEAKGYIIKAKSSTDARRTLVTITDEGKIALNERENKIFVAIDTILQKLNERETVEFYHILQKLLDD